PALSNISVPWILYVRTMMREACDWWDMASMSHGINSGAFAEAQSGQAAINSDGTLTLSVSSGSVVAASSMVSVDYYLFGEPVGTDDQKTITAFELNLVASNNLTNNHRFQVYGMTDPAAATLHMLW